MHAFRLLATYPQHTDIEAKYSELGSGSVGSAAVQCVRLLWLWGELAGKSRGLGQVAAHIDIAGVLTFGNRRPNGIQSGSCRAVKWRRLAAK